MADSRITNSGAAALTFHPPTAEAPRPAAGAPAVIVMPGGGYTFLAPHEGKPVAQWLNQLGFAAWVLEYPVGPQDFHPAPLDSVRAAMREARSQAPGLGADPSRIGLRFPVEVGLCGDARATLQVLAPLLQPRADRSFL